jgi:hypothetical protein
LPLEELSLSLKNWCISCRNPSSRKVLNDILVNLGKFGFSINLLECKVSFLESSRGYPIDISFKSWFFEHKQHLINLDRESIIILEEHSINISEIPMAVEEQDRRDVMNFLLKGDVPCQDWKKRLYLACRGQRLMGMVEKRRPKLFCSDEWLDFWIVWEASRYCLLSRMRTPIGAPEKLLSVMYSHLSVSFKSSSPRY